MSARRVLLDAAAFMDSAHASAVGSATTADIRTIVQRLLSACYDDAGKAPRLLDGEELATVVAEILPRHFGVKDPLAAAVEDVVAAYLEFLAETEVVVAAYEQRRALEGAAVRFREAVATGSAHGDGIAVTSPPATIAHRAAKTGRNDPCPCGSGKKFKKCCMRVGD